MCPYIVLILLHKKPEAMIVGIVEKKRIKVTVSYKKLSGPKLRVLTIIPERILGKENFVCSNIFIAELVALLNRKEIDLVDFEYVNIDSQLFNLVFEKAEIFIS